MTNRNPDGTWKRGAASGNPEGRKPKALSDAEETRLPSRLRKEAFATLENIKATKTGRARRKAAKLLLQYRRSRRVTKSNTITFTLNQDDRNL